GRGWGGGGRQVHFFNRSFSMRMVAVLALLSVVVGFCCTQSALTFLDAASATLDARAQVTAIPEMPRGGNVADTDHLTELQTRLVTLNGDLVRIQGSLGLSAHLPVGSSLDHTLTMANKLVQAGRYGVDAALTLIPHLKGVFSDIGSSANPATPGAQTT